MAKYILSRETCKKDLKHFVRADLYSDAVLLLVVLVIFVPLIFMGIYLLNDIWVLGIISIAVCLIFPIIFIYKLIKNILMVRLVDRDGFSIVKDTVCRLSKGELVGRYRTANVIYFTKYGRYIISPTTFGLTSIGDEFYLVVLHTKKFALKFAFHSRLYDLVE